METMFQKPLGNEIMEKRVYYIALFVVLTVALWLRIRNLGALGLYGDEDLTYLAVKGILDKGFPIMPSGMFYPRAAVFSYITALSASFFGLSEFSLRLPGIVFNLMSILIIFFFTQEILGRRVAFLVSLVYSVSAWNIEMARFARMYEMFLFFYIASAYSFYKGFILGIRKYRIITIILYTITTSIHTLGVFFIVFPLCLFLIINYRVISKLWVALYISIFVILGYSIKLFMQYFYRQALSGVTISNESSSQLIPQLTLLSGLVSKLSFENIIVLILLICVCTMYLLYLRNIYKCERFSSLNLMFSIFMVVTVIFHQYGLAFWIFSISLFMGHKGFNSLKTPYYKSSALFFLSSLIVWFGWGFYNEISYLPSLGTLSLSKKVLLSLFDYPFINMRLLFNVMPTMTIIVIISITMLFHHASQSSLHPGSIMVIVGLLGPLVAIGFFRRWPYLQYIYMVYPFFLIAYVWIIVEANKYAVSGILKNKSHGNAAKVLVLLSSIFFLFAFNNYHSFHQAKEISDRTYASLVNDIEIFEYHKHPDHKSSAYFVKKNMHNDDIIIAIDNLVVYVYLGKVDYLLRTEGILSKGRQLSNDIFLGTPVIHDLHSLKKIIDRRERKNIWLITSHEFIGPHLHRPIMDDEIIKYLEKNSDNIVYTAKDGITQVYLWES